MKWFKQLWINMTVKDVFEREKQTASLNGEPWVRVTSVEMDKDNMTRGNFELDWNNVFIDELVAAGYSGRNNEEIIDQWFTTVCHSIANEIDQ